MYYGDQRQAKTNLCTVLRSKGWEIFGYRADESDSMADYYSPAYWNGIATKNGLTMVVDVYSNSDSGKKIYKNTYVADTQAIDEKIKKVNALYERGATTGERESARVQLVKLQSRKLEEEKNVELSKVLVEEYPTFSTHPTKRTKWHLEKDGVVLASGCSLYGLYNLPDYYDLATMSFNKEYHKKYTQWETDYSTGESVKIFTDEKIKEFYTPCEDEAKAIKLLEKIIKEVEKHAQDFATIVVSDGTVEGEKAGQEQSKDQGYKKVIKTKKKLKMQMVEVTEREVQKGDYITLPHHGHYWLVTDDYMRKGTWKGEEKQERALTYECVGSESRGYQRLKNGKRYYDFYFRMVEKMKIFELKEVEVIEEYEVLEKINPEPAKTVKKKTVKSEPIPKDTETIEDSEALKVVFNEEKNGIELYFDGKPSEEVRTRLKSNGFKWSGKQKMWYAKNTHGVIKLVKTLSNSDILINNEAKEIKTENKPITESKTQQIEQQKIAPASIVLSVEYNKRMNGIEIIFKDEPNEAQKETLSSNKFRYHRSKNLWYTKYEEYKMALFEPEVIKEIII